MIPIPENKAALQKEIRFNMAYFQANRLNQTAKWLGELLVTIQTNSSESQKTASMKTKQGNNILNIGDQIMSDSSQSQHEVYSDTLDERDLQ